MVVVVWLWCGGRDTGLAVKCPDFPGVCACNKFLGTATVHPPCLNASSNYAVRLWHCKAGCMAAAHTHCGWPARGNCRLQTWSLFKGRRLSSLCQMSHGPKTKHKVIVLRPTPATSIMKNLMLKVLNIRRESNAERTYTVSLSV